MKQLLLAFLSLLEIHQRTEKNSCPHEAFILVERETKNKYMCFKGRTSAMERKKKPGGNSGTA